MRLIVLLNESLNHRFFDRLELTSHLLFSSCDIIYIIFGELPDSVHIYENLTYHALNTLKYPDNKTKHGAVKTVFTELINRHLLNNSIILNCASTMPYNDSLNCSETLKEYEFFKTQGWDWNWLSIMIKLQDAHIYNFVYHETYEFYMSMFPCKTFRRTSNELIYCVEKCLHDRYKCDVPVKEIYYDQIMNILCRQISNNLLDVELYIQIFLRLYIDRTLQTIPFIRKINVPSVYRIKIFEFYIGDVDFIIDTTVSLKDEMIFKSFEIYHSIMLGQTNYIISKRNMAFLAILCMFSNEHLAGQAIEYLNSVKGTWLDFTYIDKYDEYIFPRKLNLELVKFLLNCSEFLTDYEQVFLRNFGKKSLLDSKITDYQHSNIEIELEQKYYPKGCLPCILFCCSICKKDRPIYTQTQTQEICIFCSSYGRGYSIPSSKHEVNTFICSKCDCIYQDNQPTSEKLKPICRFCMKGLLVPSVECKLCSKKHIIPNWKEPQFQCLICIKKREVVETVISINDLFNINLPLINIYSIGQFLEAFEILKASDLMTSKMGYKIVNSSAIIKEIGDKLTEIIDQSNDKIQCIMNECSVCLLKMPDLLFYKICGNTKCTGRICINCCNKILSIGDLKKGMLVEYTKYLCPFCKHISSTISKHFSISTLKISQETISQLDSHYIAWCKICDCLKPYTRRECQQDTPVILDFTCSDCQQQISQRDIDRIVTCSNCSSYVCKALVINGLKNNLCNHVTCDSCAYHVCAHLNCGQAFKTSDRCYDHMTIYHKSWYDPKCQSDTYIHV